ncbi:MAG TPA: hypothetical protein ENH94_05020 [Phycisphaerales bacterium]|nr:hypothetical protein [Phycisphaerales bacterium]
MICRFKILAFVLILMVLPVVVYAAGIKGTPHDLRAKGAKSTCSFCHTPHGALRNTPVWNHKLSTAVYKIYSSSSLDAKVGQPTGSSKLCLSCHDGTVALGQVRRGKPSSAGTRIRPGAANLGTDLSDDHPISFIYSPGLSGKDPQIRAVSALPSHFKLDNSGELQCTTCHDSHDNTNGNFLVMSNERSAMCITCHDLEGWSGSSHESSNVAVSNTTDTYLKQTQYHTVAENGCLSCHRPHSAGGPERLLHFKNSEDNCLNCHDGTVAKTNLLTDLAKPYKHDVVRYKGVHDLKELPIEAEKHVECVDCHNPHAATKTFAEVPAASGVMEKVSGITESGSITRDVKYQYEVCFKCHGSNVDRVQPTISRQITQSDTRLEFDPSAPSFHPVVTSGKNQNVPSLNAQLTTATMIYCTDCHGSDGSGTKGPHGSNYPYLLAYRYETRDFTQESESSYQLCYQCHSRNSILNNESFPQHSKHIEEETPCSACHDPHGISNAQGNEQNNSHLINFDTSIVLPSTTNSRLEFVDQGVFRGECSLFCHEREHNTESY